MSPKFIEPSRTLSQDAGLPSDHGLSTRLRALLSAHTRRANQYLLVNVGSAVALAGAGILVAAALAGSAPAWRHPFVYILWAGLLGLALWTLRRRWWTDTAMSYHIDRAMGCDNLVRSAWLGMHQREPSAFLELNLRRAGQVAEQFMLPPPWLLRMGRALPRWVYERRRTLLSALFYLILLLLLALWLYMLLTRPRSGDSAGSKSVSDAPSAREGAPESQSAGAGSDASRTSSARSSARPDAAGSGGSPPNPTGAPGAKAAGPRRGESRQETKAQGGPGAHDNAQDKRSGAPSGAARSADSPAGVGPTAASDPAQQKGAGASGAADTGARGSSTSDRPGSTSITHGIGGTASEAAKDKRLIVMPGMEGADAYGRQPADARRFTLPKTAGKQQEAEEVRPPGRIPREYERFLKNP